MQRVHHGGKQHQSQHNTENQKGFSLHGIKFFGLFNLTRYGMVAFENKVYNQQCQKSGEEEIQTHLQGNGCSFRRIRSAFNDSPDDQAALSPGHQGTGAGAKANEHQHDQIVNSCARADDNADRGEKRRNSWSAGSHDCQSKGQQIQDKGQEFCFVAETVDDVIGDILILSYVGYWQCSELPEHW